MTKIRETCHCVKSVLIRSFSGPYFLAFGLNTERYSVSLHIQSECGKIRTRKIPNTDTFHAVCDDSCNMKRYLRVTGNIFYPDLRYLTLAERKPRQNLFLMNLAEFSWNAAS